MPWTKEQFIEFCSRCGVDPNKALKEGKVDLRSDAERSKGFKKGAMIGNARRKIGERKRRRNAINDIAEIQDPIGKSDPSVALEQKICGQAKGMESIEGEVRVNVIGLRVRPIDPDNHAAGCKGIIDGLVSSGIIEGDEWETIQVSFSQQKVTNWTEEGTRIEIDFP